MKVQKIIFLLLIACMAVGYKNESGFMGCNGCNGCGGCMGCPEEKLAEAYFSDHPLAVLFSLNGYDRFGVFGAAGNGTNDPDVIAGIGAKYYLSNNLAARFLFSFSRWSNGESDANSRTNSLFGVGLGAEYHFTPFSRISPYVGFGVGLSSISTQDMYTIPTDRIVRTQNPQASASDSINTQSYTGIGLTANAGFDWYPFHNIAIGSEYSLGYSTVSGKNKSAGIETDLPTSSKFGITGGFNIHVLVHF